MTPELEIKLTEKYPKLFVNKNKSPMETLICFGCDCGDGWYKILDHLFGYLNDLMERKFSLDYTEEYKKEHKHKSDYYENFYSYKHLPPQIVLDQVKEKYGTLRVYYHLEYENIPDEIAPLINMSQVDEKLKEYYDVIDHAIDYAEHQSAKTCEITGEDGKLYTKGWYRVLCDKEAIKNGYIPEKDGEKFIVENL